MTGQLLVIPAAATNHLGSTVAKFTSRVKGYGSTYRVAQTTGKKEPISDLKYNLSGSVTTKILAPSGIEINGSFNMAPKEVWNQHHFECKRFMTCRNNKTDPLKYGHEAKGVIDTAKRYICHYTVSKNLRPISKLR